MSAFGTKRLFRSIPRVLKIEARADVNRVTLNK
jgi:hypothetical protein